MRLYGTARVVPFEESEIADLLFECPAKELKLTPRQVVDITVDQTQTSCGYGVPVMFFGRERRVVDRGWRYKDRGKGQSKQN